MQEEQVSANVSGLSPARLGCALPLAITIDTVGEVHAMCMHWMAAFEAMPTDAAGEGFQVHAQAVQDVDAAGVQLLLSLANTLALTHRALHLMNPSETLKMACATLGAESLISPMAVRGHTP